MSDLGLTGWVRTPPPGETEPAEPPIPYSRRDSPGVLGRLYRACLDGHLPAEELPTYLRERLVSRLHGLGWTDLEIAVHTRMTVYTTVRIRSRIGLSPNPNTDQEVA